MVSKHDQHASRHLWCPCLGSSRGSRSGYEAPPYSFSPPLPRFGSVLFSLCKTLWLSRTQIFKINAKWNVIFSTSSPPHSLPSLALALPWLDFCASEEWLNTLIPIGKNTNKPFQEEAPALVAIFQNSKITSAGGTVFRTYHSRDSVAIGTGLFIWSLHHAGLVILNPHANF